MHLWSQLTSSWKTHFVLTTGWSCKWGRSYKIGSVSGAGSSWLGSDISEEIKEGRGGNSGMLLLTGPSGGISWVFLRVIKMRGQGNGVCREAGVASNSEGTELGYGNEGFQE